jgi:flagellar basal body rod protein FlgB
MANLETKKYRNRRAEFEEVCAEFQEKRNNPGAFAELLQRIANSDHCVWTVAKSAARENPLDDSEKAMIAEVVAPDLAWRSPGLVYRFKELAK